MVAEIKMKFENYEQVILSQKLIEFYWAFVAAFLLVEDYNKLLPS